jgi:U2 small nuclear ribonucleoprotein A'
MEQLLGPCSPLSGCAHTLQEREEAAAKFSDAAAADAEAAKTFEPEEDLQQAMGGPAPAAEEASEASKQPGKPSQAQLIAVKAAIANATTLEEITRLENALTTGHLPSEFQEDAGTAAGGEKPVDAMEE